MAANSILLSSGIITTCQSLATLWASPCKLVDTSKLIQLTTAVLSLDTFTAAHFQALSMKNISLIYIPAPKQRLTSFHSFIGECGMHMACQWEMFYIYTPNSGCCLLQESAATCGGLTPRVCVTTGECEMFVNIHLWRVPGADQNLTPDRGLAPAPAIHCLLEWGGSGVPPPRGEGLVCTPQNGVVCLLLERVWCASPGGEGLVCPPQEGLVCLPQGRVWCASPGPLQEGRVWCALSSKCYSYSYCHYCFLFTRGVALVNTKLSPSCLINKLRKSSYRVAS